MAFEGLFNRGSMERLRNPWELYIRYACDLRKNGRTADVPQLAPKSMKEIEDQVLAKRAMSCPQ